MLPKSRPRRRHVGGGPQRIFPPEGADRAAGPRLAAIGWGGSSGPWTAGRVPPVDMVVGSAPCPLRRSILASCAIPAGEIKLSGCSLLLDFFSFFFFCVCVKSDAMGKVLCHGRPICGRCQACADAGRAASRPACNLTATGSNRVEISSFSSVCFLKMERS